MNGYIHLTTSKTKNKTLGLCPKPHSHLRGRRGRWQTLSTYPYGECWVDSKASRVKCTTSSPLTPLHLRGVAKLTEADGAGNLSRLAKQPRSGLAFTGWRRQRSVVRVQEVSLHPCHVANVGCGATPTSVNKPLGGRVVGECAKGTHLRVMFYSFLRPLLCKGVVSTPYNHAAMQHWRLAPPIAT